MDVLSSLCGYAQSRKGHPGNAELKSGERRDLAESDEVRPPSSAFPGTRHFGAYAELGISATALPPIAWKMGSRSPSSNNSWVTPRSTPPPAPSTCAPNAWPRFKARWDCWTLSPHSSPHELPLRPRAGVDGRPGRKGIPARIPRPSCSAGSPPQSVAPSGPVSLRTTGLDGVAVADVAPHPLAAPRLRRPPLPLLPAPAQPPMAPGAAARPVARPLFPLGLHPPRRLAPAHPPDPSPALSSAL